MESQYDGKCKKCGNTWVVGDTIYGNKVNGKWACCTNKQCADSQKEVATNTSTTNTTSNHATTKTVDEASVSAIHAKFLESLDDDEIVYFEKIMGDARTQAKSHIAFYLGIRQACEACKITAHPAIGMIYNNAMANKRAKAEKEQEEA